MRIPVSSGGSFVLHFAWKSHGIIRCCKQRCLKLVHLSEYDDTENGLKQLKFSLCGERHQDLTSTRAPIWSQF